MSSQLPKLDCTKLDKASIKRYIRTEDDVQLFKQTAGYKYYMLFLARLCEAIKGQPLPSIRTDLERTSEIKSGVRSIIKMLDAMDAWMLEIPPLETPQRFGN